MQNWDRLRVFDALATHGSVRAAAEELRVSGSAISQQIRKLEHDLATVLVEPSGRGIRLTAAGGMLAHHARDVGRLVRRADEEVSQLSDEVGGRLRVGAVLSVIRSLLGPALRQLVTDHPRVEPVVSEGEPPEFIERLASRDIDAAIIESWPSNAFSGLSSLNWEQIMYDPVDLAVPSSISQIPQSIEDLSEKPWVVCPEGSGPYQTVLDLLGASGHYPDIRYQISGYGSQLDLVASGLAVALVPRLAREGREHDGVHFIHQSASVRRGIHFVTRRDETRPLIAEFRAALNRQHPFAVAKVENV